MCLRSEDAKKINKQNDIDMKNKIIAGFMGVKTIAMDELYSILRQNRENGFIHTPQAYTIDELKYHSSWDWLMPVIHKILQDNDGTEFFNFSANISHALFNNNINNAYKSVVEFINENGRELSYDEIISDLDKFDNQKD